MVYLALDRTSALKAIECAKTGNCSVWVGSDAISEEEHRRFGSEGLKLTRFNYPLACAGAEVIDEAVATIEEHNPGQVIWVQYAKRS